MDEGLAEEVGSMDAAEGCHLQSKEVEYPMKLESCNVLDSKEMVIPSEVGSPERSFHVFENMLEDKDVNRNVDPINLLEHRCTSLQAMDDAGDMVEELTVKKFDGSNLPIVGTSSNRERIQTWQSQEQKPYKLVGKLGTGTSGGGNEISQAQPNTLSDGVHASFSDLFGQRSLDNNHNDVMEQMMGGAEYPDSGKLLPHGSIKTKILSKSGFSEFFVKTTLKGKGIIYRGPPHEGFKVDPTQQNGINSSGNIVASLNSSQMSAPIEVSNAPLTLEAQRALNSFNGTGGGKVHAADDGVSLREWLRAGCHNAAKAERLCIFRQIVELVNYSHSQGFALQDLRPCFFKLSQSNVVKYIGSDVQKVVDKDFNPSENFLARRRPMEEGMLQYAGVYAKKQKFINNASLTRWPLFHSRPAPRFGTRNNISSNFSRIHAFQHESNEHLLQNTNSFNSTCPDPSNTSYQHSTSIIHQLEEKWYPSPEQLDEGVCNAFSNIYSLGVLLFELLCHFDTERAHTAAMLDLRHRIFPPNFLSENLKEAGFCLQLLHPEPSLRPTARDILRSEIINEFQEVSPEELSSSIHQDDAESELLLHFLVSLKEQKQKHAFKLVEDIHCLEADLEEVQKRHCYRKPFVDANKNLGKAPLVSEVCSTFSPVPGPNESRLLKNINQLETAYFSMRSKISCSEANCKMRSDKDLLRKRENCYLVQSNDEIQDSTDSLGSFYDGLCKYARYSKFEVCGILRNGEFSNSANVICSLSFDRDEEFFAAAGVSKKIKIFDFNALFKDSIDIHYPAIEIPNKSKLSCVCWNNYVKNYLASTDYDGVVKLWDASTGQAVSQYIEHEKRAWSVDFSPVYPTKLASGSDDCSVKLWSVNERKCLGTIRNIANVCCVQFSRNSTNLLAFGSSDFRTYCYDLRNARVPWCVLVGHEKAVSFVRFLDSETIVSASTDNTLKLWDLNKTSSSGLSTNACSLTFGGHTNEKNFVGLSVASGYIACGSETNEVYAYYRSLPMPITSHKFGSIDPISGRETDDDNGLFVSSVCWREKTDMVVAANSSGCIKVLQMV